MKAKLLLTFFLSLILMQVGAQRYYGSTGEFKDSAKVGTGNWIKGYTDDTTSRKSHSYVPTEYAIKTWVGTQLSGYTVLDSFIALKLRTATQATLQDSVASLMTLLNARLKYSDTAALAATRWYVRFKVDSVAATVQNLATADLSFTADRVHNVKGYTLTLDSMGTFNAKVLNQTYIYTGNPFSLSTYLQAFPSFISMRASNYGTSGIAEIGLTSGNLTLTATDSMYLRTPAGTAFGGVATDTTAKDLITINRYTGAVTKMPWTSYGNNYVPNSLNKKTYMYVPNYATGSAVNYTFTMNNRSPLDTLFPGTNYATTAATSSGGMFVINRYYYEKAGDNATQQYSAPFIILSRTVNDTASTYWDSSRVQPLQDVGIKAVYQLFPSKKQSIYTSPFGWTGATNISLIGVGEGASYDITLKNANSSSGVSATYAMTPWSPNYSEWDYNRGNIPNSMARVIKGPVGTAGYYADCKSHQTGAISLNSGNVINRWSGFYAVGPLYMTPFGTANTKAEILAASKISRVTAFDAGSMWRPYNETDTGYAFVSENKYDESYLNGAVKLGGTLPSIADTIYNLYVDGRATRRTSFDNQYQYFVGVHRYTAGDGTLTGAPQGTARSSMTLTNTTADIYVTYTNPGQSPWTRMFLNGGQAGFQVYPTYDAGATQSGANISFFLQDSVVRINSSLTFGGIRSSKPFRSGVDAIQLFGRRNSNGDWLNVPIATSSDNIRVLVNSATDDATSALQVSGDIRASGSVKVGTLLNLPANTAPTSSADSSGSDGDVRRDNSGNIYIKYPTIGWIKFAGATF